MAVLFIFLLGLAGCASSGRPEPSTAIDPWKDGGLSGQRIVTPHFELFTTVTDTEFVAALPRLLESAHDQFEKTLPSPADNHRLTSYLFQSRPQWEHFCRERWPARSDVVTRIHLGGYTSGDTSASFFADRSTAIATLVHESWHQYVAARFDSMPGWLHEGMACYFEAVEWDGATPRCGSVRNSFRLNSLRAALEPGRWRPLAELLDSRVADLLGSGDSCATHEYYAQVWALVVYLQHSGQNAHAQTLTTLFHDIADGSLRTKVSAWRVTSGVAPDIDYAAAVFQTYFGSNLAPMDLALKQYAQKLCGL